MITTIEGNKGQAVRKVERSYLNNSYVDGFGDNGGPAARIRFNQKNKIEDILKDYKDEINKAAKKYGVPPALIAGIIVKEQITQSIHDEVVLCLWLSRLVKYNVKVRRKVY